MKLCINAQMTGIVFVHKKQSANNC